MQLRQLKSQFLATLTPHYDAAEAARFFDLLLDAFESKKRIDLVLEPELETQQVDRWQLALLALQKFKPIQYIIGTTVFFDLLFEVTPATLIPRPETEELVDWILRDTTNPNIALLDMGTGSGCIAIALAKNLPNAQVMALDISSAALEVAQRNAMQNGVTIQFINQSILDEATLFNCFAHCKLDIIVSNPPYVRLLEKHEIQPNVLDYEPHLALFVADEDALLFYRHIGNFAYEHLKKGGKLYVEINQYLGNETVNLMQQIGFEAIELRKDCYGNDRMLRCIR
jgi:release factor glutamine methyltransferase